MNRHRGFMMRSLTLSASITNRIAGEYALTSRELEELKERNGACRDFSVQCWLEGKRAICHLGNRVGWLTREDFFMVARVVCKQMRDVLNDPRSDAEISQVKAEGDVANLFGETLVGIDIWESGECLEYILITEELYKALGMNANVSALRRAA